MNGVMRKSNESFFWGLTENTAPVSQSYVPNIVGIPSAPSVVPDPLGATFAAINQQMAASQSAAAATAKAQMANDAQMQQAQLAAQASQNAKDNKEQEIETIA